MLSSNTVKAADADQRNVKHSKKRIVLLLLPEEDRLKNEEKSY